MAMSAGSAEGEPMVEMNTTPLIDVMLVLLIMMIITIPIQSHAVKIDLPQTPKDAVKPPVDPEKNKIFIDEAGRVFWNSVPVDDTLLRQYLDATKAQPVEPELHFQPAPTARYEVVDHVLAIVKRANITKLGFVGNEQYGRDF
ncbi:biopolymer transporter ExbD [Sphingomonas sp. G-3-2-10]|jgi:biopolymer transport protein ExbD|uniref:ExbD/TolR family protein n=1 Tax=Sphingomonas sp. G-3-2-10 TaxID=2728838 RepID=UPI00146DB2D1|nr:biopolymer transporter ExbD [Sphingomonas sp. G-3-2-10]NML04938.1 biopolymer transporter ExbD [Sphingomonas sp. G-3-2-10]